MLVAFVVRIYIYIYIYIHSSLARYFAAEEKGRNVEPAA